MELGGTLAELFDRSAERSPHADAFVIDEHPVSYSEFQEFGRRAAAWLADQGISKGDRVAVWVVNRIEWLALLYGASILGIAIVSVNTRYRATELQHILSRSGARMLVLDEQFRQIDFLAQFEEVPPQSIPDLQSIAVLGAEPLARTPVSNLELVRFHLNGRPVDEVRQAGTPDDLALLFATSGTTKLPKLVMHSQRSLSYHSTHLARSFGFDAEGARLLAALPFCGVFGLNPVLAALTGGATVYLMEAFDSAQACTLIEKHAITHVFGTDDMFRQILEHAPDNNPLSKAKVVGFAAIQAGAEDLARQAWKRGVPMTGLYGASEVNALFSRQGDRHSIEERIKGGGFPVSPDAQIRIRDPESKKLLPPGETGVIEIRSPSNFVGYWNDPEATARAIDAEGFYNTGDLGNLRRDGSFIYETRMDDAMRLSGFLVMPAEIEDTLKGIDGVADAQVVSVNVDGKMRCAAFVIPAPDASIDADGLIAETSRLMAPYKVPARVWFVDSFPVTQSANGMKIQRSSLRRMADGRLAAETPVRTGHGG